MALAKLTASGEVQVTGPWARPDVYELWLQQLGRRDYETIFTAMNEAVTKHSVVRAQYIACRPNSGEDWFEEYKPVWTAMNRDREMAGKFLGLILWEVMYNRPEQWYFHKIDKTIVNDYSLVEDIQVMEYFRSE